MGLGGQTAATAGTDATPDGGALVWVVVVGLGFRAIEDGVEGARGGPQKAVKGMPRWAMPMRGAKGKCNWFLLILV
jgi:hypothetical protein